MLKRFLNHKTEAISLAAGIMAVSALASRVLGVARDGLLAKVFGAGAETDIYLAAFRIPDLVYNVIIAGGITVAFLPLFSEYNANDSKKAWQFTNNTLNIFLALIVFLCSIFFIFAPALTKLITPGFNPEEISKTVLLSRLMLLSPIFFGLSAFFSGVLQYFGRFVVYGLCPILYNLGIIFGILFLTPRFGIMGVAIGVVLGAFLHFAIQIPAAWQCGFRYRPLFDFSSPGVKRIFLLMIPRTFGIAANQINLIVITAIASTLSSGSIAVFNFANNLQNFPIGIIGISYAVAVFPALSKNWFENKKDEFVKSFSSAFRQVLYLIIPASVLMFILRSQIVNVIYGHGQFAESSARLTAASLGIFVFGIFGLALIPLVFRAFFSFQDTKTPSLIAAGFVVFDIILSIALVRLLQFPNIFSNIMRDAFSLRHIDDISVLGLPLAFSFAAVFQFFISMFFLRKRIGDFGSKEISDSLFKMLAGAAFLALGVGLAIYLSCYFIAAQGFWLAFWQIIIGGLAGVLIYIIVTFLIRSPEISVFLSSLLKKPKK